MKTSHTDVEGKLRWLFGVLFALVYLVLIRTIEWRQLLSSSDQHRQLGVGAAFGVGTCVLMLCYAGDLRRRTRMFLLLLAAEMSLLGVFCLLFRSNFLDLLALGMLLIEPVAVYLLFRNLFGEKQA